ncbi:MAG: MFS transporter [Desulfarculus sp.]|jgi:nitrate/nitrite transporter NarK|nr:MAG: MFS transporter [Desulfarculus sp.]
MRLLNRHVVIALAAATGMGAALLILSPILPALKEFYGVSNALLGMLVTALVLTHALVQIPGGVVVDRLGARWSLTLALTLAFVGSALPYLNQSYPLVLAARVVVGLGTGLGFVASLKYVTAHSAAQRAGLTQGFFGGLINVGCIIPFLISPLLLSIDWRLVFLFSALLFLLPLLALLIWGQEPAGGRAETGLSLGRVLKQGPVWALGLCHCLYFGVTMTVATWIASYLVSLSPEGMLLAAAGLWGSLATGFSALGRFVGGFTLRLVAPQRLILGSVFMLALAFALLVASSQVGWSVFLFVLVYLSSSLTFASVFWLAYTLAPRELAGTSIGLVNSIASLGALLFPVAFGLILDQTASFAWGFVFLMILSLGGLAPAGFLYRRANREAQAGPPAGASGAPFIQAP